MLRIQLFFTALPLAFGALHLLLYAALPRLRSNLYYGLFLIFIAGTIYLDFEEQLRPWSEQTLLLLRLHRVGLAASFVFGIKFFYDAFLGFTPRRYRYIAGALIAAGLIALLDPVALFWPLQFAIIAGLLETLRAMIHAIREGREGARLIAGGALVFAAFASYDFLLDFNLIEPLGELTNAYQFGLVGLFVATSTFLARSIAQTTTRLVEQERIAHNHEVERRLLEAEVSRTSAELEQARRLQLSLLPTSLPSTGDLEAAAILETASEVGGDYYDFREEEDGSLAVAIGDATGHGLRAGFMVAVAKSLFHGLRRDESMPSFFNRCTRVIKPMGLGNLYMALMLLRLSGGTATISAAGMPPVLLRRAETGDVETHTLKGMPLGAFHDFPYQEVEVTVQPGDVLLLMSDGLMELFNEDRELYGLERVIASLQDAPTGSADDIIRHVRRRADAWRRAHSPEDDMTLVVIKKKPEPPARAGDARTSHPSSAELP